MQGLETTYSTWMSCSNGTQYKFTGRLFTAGAKRQVKAEARIRTHGQEQDCQRICRHRLHRTLRGPMSCPRLPIAFNTYILGDLWESPLIIHDPQWLWESYDPSRSWDKCNDSYHVAWMDLVMLNYAGDWSSLLLCSVGSLCSELVCTKTLYSIPFVFSSIAQI